MHTIDIIVVCAAAVIVVLCGLVLARQRFMLQAAGSIPLAIRVTRASGARWLYGVARYAGGELRWYRALGLGTKASRAWQRSDLTVLSKRSPGPDELGALPATAVIVECSDTGSGAVTFALGESAYTGFVSWLESSAPLS